MILEFGFMIDGTRPIFQKSSIKNQKLRAGSLFEKSSAKTSGNWTVHAELNPASVAYYRYAWIPAYPEMTGIGLFAIL